MLNRLRYHSSQQDTCMVKSSDRLEKWLRSDTLADPGVARAPTPPFGQSGIRHCGARVLIISDVLVIVVVVSGLVTTLPVTTERSRHSAITGRAVNAGPLWFCRTDDVRLTTAADRHAVRG